MNEERRRILKMVAEGKITAQEAEQLLDALDDKGAASGPGGPAGQRPDRPKFLRVEIEHPGETREGERHVSVRVPLSLVRAGVRLASVLPGTAGEHVTRRLRERGIDLAQLAASGEQLEDIVANLQDLTIDLDGGRGKVRLSCE